MAWPRWGRGAARLGCGHSEGQASSDALEGADHPGQVQLRVVEHSGLRVSCGVCEAPGQWVEGLHDCDDLAL